MEFKLTMPDGSTVQGNTSHRTPHLEDTMSSKDMMRPGFKTKRQVKIQGSRRRWTPRGTASSPSGFVNSVYSDNTGCITVDPAKRNFTAPPCPSLLTDEYYQGTGGAL